MLCNGNNGTPNLLDKFIVGGGPGSSYGTNTGAMGGSTQHTITINEMPAHAHNYTKAVWGGGNNGARNGDNWGNNANVEKGETVGGGSSIDIRPPYYSLFYIMKR
jgi:microcystin-dependent protein